MTEVGTKRGLEKSISPPTHSLFSNSQLLFIIFIIFIIFHNLGAEWSLREKQKVAEIAEKGGGPTLPPMIVGPSVTSTLFRYSFRLFNLRFFFSYFQFSLRWTTCSLLFSLQWSTLSTQCSTAVDK